MCYVEVKCGLCDILFEIMWGVFVKIMLKVEGN